jgi:hypothetical protein
MQNFLEHKTHIKQHVLKMQQISLLLEQIKYISRCVFLHALTYASTGLEKVNVTSKNKTWMFD